MSAKNCLLVIVNDSGLALGKQWVVEMWGGRCVKTVGEGVPDQSGSRDAEAMADSHLCGRGGEPSCFALHDGGVYEVASGGRRH